MPELKTTPLDRRALGLALTRTANLRASDALGASPEVTSARARRIGITGAPGAGKSTLIGRLALERMNAGRVGVLAIDPTSSTSGGAILGDRIRMDDLAGIEELYIRSFASRSASDGLTDNVPELLATMDRFAFDEVIVETVGVGQAELGARSQVDTLVLVIPPDAGDVVQAMKAGIMEVADIFAIHKADLPSAMKMATDVRGIVGLTPPRSGAWTPPVVLTSQSSAGSVRELSDHIDRHLAWLLESGEMAARAFARRKHGLRRWFERRILEIVERAPAASFDGSHAAQVAMVVARLLDDAPSSEQRR